MSENTGGNTGNSPGGRRRRRFPFGEEPPGQADEDTRSFFGTGNQRYEVRGQARSFFNRIPGYDEIENPHDQQLADHYIYVGWFDPFATTDERNAARQAYYDLSFTDGSMFPWNDWHREIYGE